MYHTIISCRVLLSVLQSSRCDEPFRLDAPQNRCWTGSCKTACSKSKCDFESHYGDLYWQHELLFSLKGTKYYKLVEPDMNQSLYIMQLYHKRWSKTNQKDLSDKVEKKFTELASKAGFWNGWMKVPPIVQHLFPGFTWRIQTAEPVLFLSFDDGPNPMLRRKFLNILEQYKAKATFFVQEKIFISILFCFNNCSQQIILLAIIHGIIYGWKTTTSVYIEDVNRCDESWAEKFENGKWKMEIRI